MEGLTPGHGAPEHLDRIEVFDGAVTVATDRTPIQGGIRLVQVYPGAPLAGWGRPDNFGTIPGDHVVPSRGWPHPRSLEAKVSVEVADAAAVVTHALDGSSIRTRLSRVGGAWVATTTEWVLPGERVRYRRVCSDFVEVDRHRVPSRTDVQWSGSVPLDPQGTNAHLRETWVLVAALPDAAAPREDIRIGDSVVDYRVRGGIHYVLQPGDDVWNLPSGLRRYYDGLAGRPEAGSPSLRNAPAAAPPERGEGSQPAPVPDLRPYVAVGGALLILAVVSFAVVARLRRVGAGRERRT